MKVNINHIAKIEGHMGFVGHILEGNMSKAKLEVQEGARLIEGILKGRPHGDAPIITSRICGVCPIVHNICSIKALEDAVGITPSQGTVTLRKLLLLAQTLQSHSVHLFFFALPDYFGMDKTVKLTEKMEKETKMATELRGFSDKLAEVVGGRAVHPMNAKPGGFGRMPEKEKLQEVHKETRKILENAEALAEIFAGLSYPDFKRETESVSLSAEKEYAFYEGKVNASDAKPLEAKDFLPQIREIESPFDVVKRGRYKGSSYMVGALARINNNRDKLNPRAYKIAKDFFTEGKEHNVFHNNFAQAVEVVHSLEEAEKLIENFLSSDHSAEEIVNTQDVPRPESETRGLGVVEAPRGILFHAYHINEEGKIRKANIISPTAQFLQNMEDDLEKLLPHLKEMEKEERERKIKMLVRAYDPCISCATH